MKEMYSKRRTALPACVYVITLAVEQIITAKGRTKKMKHYCDIDKNVPISVLHALNCCLYEYHRSKKKILT